MSDNHETRDAVNQMHYLRGWNDALEETLSHQRKVIEMNGRRLSIINASEVERLRKNQEAP